jgi:hypothetical protein
VRLLSLLATPRHACEADCAVAGREVGIFRPARKLPQGRRGDRHSSSIPPLWDVPGAPGRGRRHRRPVLNDHLLKGGGLLPGWFAGKLSDVCGLMVAPVSLVLLLGVRGRLRRLGSLLAVAGLFWDRVHVRTDNVAGVRAGTPVSCSAGASGARDRARSSVRPRPATSCASPAGASGGPEGSPSTGARIRLQERRDFYPRFVEASRGASRGSSPSRTPVRFTCRPAPPLRAAARGNGGPRIEAPSGANVALGLDAHDRPVIARSDQSGGARTNA